MFLEIDNFLTEEECRTAIAIHEKYYDSYGDVYRDTHVYRASNMILNDKMYLGVDFPEAFFIRKLFAIINSHIQKIDREAFINYFQFVRWPTNSFQEKHTDLSHHIYTSIIYLNNDFSGGQTFIEDNVIQSKTGKIVTFNGSITNHGVTPVTSGTRYTLPVWYTVSPELFKI